MEYPLQFLCRGLRAVGLVLLYYCFSIGITFYNKWLLKEFHFPLFMTLVHLMIIFILAAVTRTLIQCWTGKPRVVLGWSQYLTKAAPTGQQCAITERVQRQLSLSLSLTALATALDIGLSNWSFLFITISLYTMTKSSAVLFILFFSLVFKLEEKNPCLIVVVVLIASGLFMFTFESTQFNVEGFVLVLLASFIGGIRWTLTQILLQKAELGLQNPVDTMYHLQPLMFVGLFPLFLYNEGLSLCLSEKLFRVSELPSLLHSLLTLSAGGALAFGLGFSEFLLVSKTSSLTLSISGIFKGWRGDLEAFDSSRYGTPSGVERRSGGVRIVSVWDSFRGGEEIWRGKAGQVRLQSLKNSSSDNLPLLRRDGCSEEEEEDHDEDH
ncbi:UNVERIFIED_CONTAM: hypothetical protein FKN15_048587 [Acipenser sinensis]